jgi:hypothetical protein
MEKLKLIWLGCLLVSTTLAAPGNLTITDDAYLENGVRKNDAYLMVETDSSRNRISYLKVDLSTLPTTVTNAVLTLTTTSEANESGGSGTINIYEGSDTGWTEDTLSTANAPVEGAILASASGTYAPNQEVTLDLTSFMASTSQSTLSLIIKMESGGNDTWFGSMEGTGAPVLLINDDGSGSVPSDRDVFDKSKDLLLAQFDSKPDADDIHAQAALGSMLAHADLAGVNYFAVAGAIGTQSGDFIDSRDLFSLAFGAENTYWTDAYADWAGSVTRIKTHVRTILDAGGKVWVQEAGQSNITADWIAALISDGVAEAVIKENVMVVQHSDWNESKTASADLAYVKEKANYIAIDDGNADAGDYSSRAYRGPETPNYTSSSSSWLINAKSDSNTNTQTRALWIEADRIIDESGFSGSYSVIPGGGVDFSDCCENWWIFSMGSDADSVAAFWNRYVAEEQEIVIPPGTTVFQEANGLVVMDIESVPIVSGWVEETTIAGYLGTSYYTATTDSFNTPGNGLLEYTFQVANAGDYQFQWRSRITAGDSYTDYNDNFARLVDSSGNPVVPVENDLWITGDQWLKVYMNTEGAWVWHAKNHDNDPKAIAWDLEAGQTYTVQVSYRSKGHGIDRLLLWNRTGFGYSFGNLTGAANNTAAMDALPLSAQISADPILFDALTDFEISSVASGDVPYYKDTVRGALAIDATVLSYRDKFARAILSETVSAGTYDVTLAAMGELDGNCTYQLYVNDVLIGSKTNSPTTTDYALQEHTFSGVTIPANAEIIVKSNDVSNEQVSEDGGWAYARGRWTTLSFAPASLEGHPTVSFNTPSGDTYVYVGTDLSVIVDASDSDDMAWVELYKDDVLIRRDEAAPYQWNEAALQDLEEGSFVLKATASDSLGNESSASITVAVLVDPPVQQAEDFSDMFEIQSEVCTDAGGGQNIGYIQNGDWAEYSINLPAAGMYSVDFRVATDYAGGTIQLRVDGAEVGSASVSNTGGWQAWVTVHTTATFDSAGPQTLRLNFVGGSSYLFNVNWFEMMKVDDPSGYEIWAATNGIIGDATDDDDGNGLKNFLEYAISEAPVFVQGEGRFEYVYKKRTDDSELAYTVETCTNLVSGAWTNMGVTVVGTNVTGETYNDVTNRIPTDLPQAYIRLRIEN